MWCSKTSWRLALSSFIIENGSGAGMGRVTAKLKGKREEATTDFKRKQNRRSGSLPVLFAHHLSDLAWFLIKLGRTPRTHHIWIYTNQQRQLWLERFHMHTRLVGGKSDRGLNRNWCWCDSCWKYKCHEHQMLVHSHCCCRWLFHGFGTGASCTSGSDDFSVRTGRQRYCVCNCSYLK